MYGIILNILSVFSMCELDSRNTPDFILADYLQLCLNAFDMTVNTCDAWYGVRLEPGRSSFLCTDPEEESAISEESFGTIDGPKY